MQGDDLKYAGLFSRLVSSLIDGAIFLGLLKLLTVVVTDGSIVYLLGLIVLSWLYIATLLSSSWHATIGQKLLGVSVLSVDGEPLTFRQASLRVLYFFILSPLILPLIMYFFSARDQTLYDYLSKSVVIDNWVSDTAVDNTVVTPKRKRRIFRTILVTLVSVVWMGFTAYVVFYMSVMYLLYSSRDAAYDNSFHQTYTTNDYNDSRIQFYDVELRKYSRDFIEADEIYTIFEADVKRDLASGCIQYFVRRYDNDGWINMGSGFRQNARNSHTNTEEKIEKAKENESFLGHNFYTYDTNMVNDIEEDITKLWSDDNESVCEIEESVEVMYKGFIVTYLDRFISQNIQGYSAPSKQEQEWYKTLQTRFPDYFEAIRRQEIALAKEVENRKLKKLEESAKRKKLEFNQAIKEKKNRLFAAIWYEQDQVVDLILDSNTDLDLKDRFGRTPLFIAVQVGNSYALEQLLKHGANMYIMDEYGLYTAFTELLSHPRIDMKMVKLFLEYGYDLNFQYKRSETALSAVAKGCENIELVKLFLELGADPTLMDRYQSNTILKVQRGCKNSKQYKQLLDLLE